MNQVVRTAKVVVEEIFLETTLYVLDMQEFDVILGMDWLSKHHVTILCFEKEIVCKYPEGVELCLSMAETKHLPRVISALKAKKLLQSGGCIRFVTP